MSAIYGSGASADFSRRMMQPGRTGRAPDSMNTDKAGGAKKNLLRGRFKRARLPEVEAFTASLPFDRRLYRHDIRGSVAHARMIAKVGLISNAQADRIVMGLKQIEREIDAGSFRFDLTDEDIHLAIERRLTEI